MSEKFALVIADYYIGKRTEKFALFIADYYIGTMTENYSLRWLASLDGNFTEDFDDAIFFDSQEESEKALEEIKYYIGDQIANIVKVNFYTEE